MTTTRRAFLSFLAASAASPLLDVDRLLWVPGAKTWFLPTPKASLFTLQGQADEMCRIVGKCLRANGLRVELVGACGDGKLGSVGLASSGDTITFEHQYAIGMHPLTRLDATTEDEVRQKFVAPAACALADTLIWNKAQATTPLISPLLGARAAVAHDAVTGVSVRLISDFSPGYGDSTRADILCAHA